MSTTNQAIAMWEKMSGVPGGKWIFSRIVANKAPYFGSISPRFEELRPGYCEVSIRKRRAVENHLGTVHAIAMCNMAELAGGLATDVTLPGDYRWIPKGMTVEYLAKATTDLRAVAEIPELPELGDARELPVNVKVTDSDGQVVFTATIRMWVSKKQR